ncbi:MULTISPECIES: hypothetical protein [Moorena]|uniref:hypothetical protein n=1 Tax=Moorena TaxID=1155738 RepID=UPI00105696E9|nr:MULTISPECIES: hypothetical protein [Moorena]NER87590.1 hypothetical protein [Moorena sp. SIO3A2]
MSYKFPGFRKQRITGTADRVAKAVSHALGFADAARSRLAYGQTRTEQGIGNKKKNLCTS